ncbi:MAG: metallopeptidase TldD-related protein, partial [Holophagae bacterium]
MTTPEATAIDLGGRLIGAIDDCGSRLDDGRPCRWEVFAKASLSRETEVIGGRLRRSVQVEESGVGIRLAHDGRVGFAAGSGLEATGTKAVVDAVRTAAVTGDDPMPPRRLLGTTEVPPGPSAPARGWAQHIAGELAMAIATSSDGMLRLDRAVVQEGLYGWRLATGDGWSASDERAVASVLVDVLVGGGSGVWREWIHIADPSLFDAREAAARVGNRALLTGHPVVTDHGLHDLLLHPEVAAQLLATLSPLFLATPADRDPLPGLLDPEGLLAAYPLSLVDDRADATAPLVGPCDGEGLPAQRTLLVDKGAPRHRIASYADAVAHDEVPRGGALRLSYRDRPATGLANLRVLTDDGMAAGELLAASDRALYLLRPLAPVACDFSADSYRLIASGVWLDRQRVRGWHPVVELTGGLGTLLRR